MITENPFRILALNQVYRSQALDRVRKNNGMSEHEQDSKVPYCRSGQGV